MEFDHRKLFVGGVSQETKEETLTEHFGKYGEVIVSEIIRDRSTGNGRGFGFVTFADPSVVAAALHDEHIILERKVEVKVAKPKGEQLSNKKVFVGGLPPSLTDEELKEYFERFGSITDAIVICDKESNRSRGFGFITFDSENVVYNVLQNNFYILNDKFVEVKKAKPKDRSSRHMHTYECELRQPYVYFDNSLPASIPSYGVVSSYYHEPAYKTFSNFALSSYYQYPLSYENHCFYPTYTNGWASRPVRGNDSCDSYCGNSIFTGPGPVGVSNGNSTFMVSGNSIEDDKVEVPKHTIRGALLFENERENVQPPAHTILPTNGNGAFFSENEEENIEAPAHTIMPQSNGALFSENEVENVEALAYTILPQTNGALLSENEDENVEVPMHTIHGALFFENKREIVQPPAHTILPTNGNGAFFSENEAHTVMPQSNGALFSENEVENVEAPAYTILPQTHSALLSENEDENVEAPTHTILPQTNGALVSENEDENVEALAHKILPQTNGASFFENDSAEHRKGADCQSTPCKSS